MEIPIQALKFCLLLMEMLTEGLSVRVSAILGIRDWGAGRVPNKASASETHLSPPKARNPGEAQAPLCQRVTWSVRRWATEAPVILPDTTEKQLLFESSTHSLEAALLRLVGSLS